MDGMSGKNIIWSLISQSDFMTQMVMLILFVMSTVCWAITLYKLILIRVKQEQCLNLLEKMQPISSLHSLASVAQEFKKTFSGYALIQLLTFAKSAQETKSIELFELQADGLIDDMMEKEESYVSVLSISASVATLLGLFGTVWGLIHAFVRISEKQSADIVAVAPGISEALITTIAGLVVAIPALIFAQYITIKIKSIEHNLMKLTDRVTMLLRLSLLGKTDISSNNNSDYIL